MLQILNALAWPTALRKLSSSKKNFARTAISIDRNGPISLKFWVYQTDRSRFGFKIDA